MDNSQSDDDWSNKPQLNFIHTNQTHSLDFFRDPLYPAVLIVPDLKSRQNNSKMDIYGVPLRDLIQRVGREGALKFKKLQLCLSSDGILGICYDKRFQIIVPDCDMINDLLLWSHHNAGSDNHSGRDKTLDVA